MKKKCSILLFSLLLTTGIYSQTLIYSEGFETDGEGVRYTSNTFTDCPNSDYFFRTNTNPVTPPSCTAQFSTVLTTLQGSFFWASEDIKGSGGTCLNCRPAGDITTQSFNIAGYTSMNVSLYLATSGNNGTRWENTDKIEIQVSIDGGSFTTVGRFLGKDPAPLVGAHLGVDGNLNGIYDVGVDPATDCDNANFTQYTFNIPGSGSNMQVKLFVDEAGGSEELAVDQFEVRGTFTGGPEINVQGNGVNILDGDVTPSSADHTDFGNLSICSGTLDRTFTIQNTGTSGLTISGTTITGAGSSDYTMITPPASSISAGGSTTMVVRFNPSVSGARNATITINNNDANETAYDFAITGTGVDPEINVQGNSVNIADGDVTPSISDHTDFGSQSVCSGTIVRTYTIQNIGTSNLSISSVNISGTNAADFSLTALPGNPVAAASTTTFQITFNPSATGLRNATISIINGDCDEGTYDFAIQGSGTDPEMNILGNSVSIADGDVTPSLSDFTDFGNESVCSAGTLNKQFTIQNTGTSNLTLTIGGITITGANAADFSLFSIPSTNPVIPGGTSTFFIAFDPSASGIRSATLTIPNDDCDENPYNFSIQGTGVDPEINVIGNSLTIIDGDATPSLTDHTDFGSQSVCSGTIVRTFTIQNTGNADLNATSFSFTGTNAADFSFVGLVAANPLLAGNSTTMQVSFDPSAPGLRTANLVILSNDCDEATYNFAIQGTGGDPEINVLNGVTTIVDGDVTPSIPEGTDFGGISVCSGIVSSTYTIQNTGTSNLVITSIGTPTDFTTTGISFPATILPGSNTTFTANFNPSILGPTSGTLTINNNDCDETVYDYLIQGIGQDPEMNVQGNTISIADNDVTPSATDHTDFGSQAICAGTISRTYTIQNTGFSTPLTIGAGGITITGAGAVDFALSGITLPASIPNGSSTTFTITFNPSTPGLRSATVNIANNDCNENPYNYAIQGTGTDPEIDLQGNSVSIIDGDVTPTTADHTDFGIQSVCSGTLTRTFSIQNTGTAVLNISGVTITGVNASDYSVTTAPPSNISAGGSATFVVSFNPSANGIRNATLNINNNDCDETVYDFAITGFGIDPEINIMGNGNNIVNGDITPSTTDFTDFGNTGFCGGSITRTFTYENQGNGNLNLSNFTITGANAADFSIISSPPISMSGSSFTIFTIGFDPSAIGVRTATINIFTNDCDESLYSFSIQGTGDPDIIPPTAICQNISINLDALGNATILASQINNGSNDACGIASISVSPNTFTCANIGANTVILTVTDNSGNVSTCNAIVTVNDITPPTAMCQNVGVSLNATGTAVITGADVNNGSTDACGIATLSVSPNTFTCANIGNNNAVLTVTDNNGNTSTCNLIVSVNDILNPVPDLSVLPDVIGQCNVTVSAPTATDNCAGTITGTTTDPTTYNTQGTYTITWNYMDAFGNTVSQDQNVIVDDVTAPAPDVSSLPNIVGECSATLSAPTATDICTGPITATTTDPVNYNSQGTYTVTWTYNDGNGNTTTQTQTVVVDDTTNPVISNIPADIIVTADPGDCTTTASWTVPTATDNCSILLFDANANPGDLFGVGIITVTYEAVDDAGNLSSASFTVTVLDAEAPVFTSCPVNILGCENDIISYTLPSGADNCGPATLNYSGIGSGVVYPVGVTTNTYLLTDGSGNSDTCIFTVTILAAPTITFNQPIDTLCTNSGSINLSATPLGGTFSGNGVSGNTFDPALAGIGIHTIVYTYTDGNSCSNSDSSDIVVTSCLGVENTSNTPNIKIYPNPVVTSITIESIQFEEGGYYRIFDPLGREILNGKLTSMVQIVPVENLVPGVYLLSIERPNQKRMVHRIVKQN